MVNRSHGRGASGVTGSHDRPGGRSVGGKVSPGKVSPEVVGGGRRRRAKVQTAVAHVTQVPTRASAMKRVQVSPNALARVQSQTQSPGLAVLITDNRLIRTLTTHWKDIAFVVVGTSLAVVGVTVTLSTLFFWLGVSLTVAGALMMLIGVSSMGRNAEMLRNLFQAEKSVGEVLEEAHIINDLVQDAAVDVREVERVVQQNEKRLEEDAAALRKAHEAAEATKKNQAEVGLKMGELDSIMDEVKRHNASIEYLSDCIHRVTEDLQSTGRIISQLHGKIQGANGDIFEMVKVLCESWEEQTKRVEELHELQEAPSEADVKEFQKSIKMIQAVLLALEDEQSKLTGLEEKHLKMVGQFDALQSMTEKLREHHRNIQTIMQRAHDKRSEIRKILDENKDLVVEFDGALGEMDRRIGEFSTNDAKIMTHIQHLDGVLAEIHRGITSIEVKAKEAADAIQLAKETAGAGYMDTLKRLGLVGLVGVGAMTIGPAVAMTAGVGVVVYSDLDQVRRGLGVICGVLNPRKWNPFG